MKIHYTIESYLKETNQTYLVGISSREKFEENGFLLSRLSKNGGHVWCSCTDETSMRNYNMGFSECVKCVEKRKLIRKLKLKRILK